MKKQVLTMRTQHLHNPGLEQPTNSFPLQEGARKSGLFSGQLQRVETGLKEQGVAWHRSRPSVPIPHLTYPFGVCADSLLMRKKTEPQRPGEKETGPKK